MKFKKLVMMLLLFSVLTICTFYNNITKAEGETEEKIYCDATIDDEFADNEILIVLTNEESLKFSEYTVNSFSEINCIAIDDLTDGYKDKIEQQLNGTYTGNMSVNLSTFNRIFKLTLGINSKQYVLNSIKELEKRSDILSAEPNCILEVASENNSGNAVYSRTVNNNEQWTIDFLNLNEAWELVNVNSNIKIAIIDSGVSVNHSELEGKFSESLSYTYNSNYAGALSDYDGHGTMIAGIITADTEDDTGIKGICDGATMVSYNIGYVMSTGDIDLNISFIASAIERAAEDDINIINMSLRYYLNPEHPDYQTILYSDSYIKEAIQNFPGLVVCGAGNEHLDNDDVQPAYPASYGYSNIISVGACDADGYEWYAGYLSGSNFGKETVDLYAPGVDIYSTYLNNGFYTGSGTSFAVPHVVGVAALVWSVNPSLTTADVRNIVVTSTIDKTDLSELCVSGGVLNAYKAVLHATHYTDSCECLESDLQYFTSDASYHIVECTCGYRVYEPHTFAISSLSENNELLAVNRPYICIKCGYTSLISSNTLGTAYYFDIDKKKEE